MAMSTMLHEEKFPDHIDRKGQVRNTFGEVLEVVSVIPTNPDCFRFHVGGQRDHPYGAPVFLFARNELALPQLLLPAYNN